MKMKEKKKKYNAPSKEK